MMSCYGIISSFTFIVWQQLEAVVIVYIVVIVSQNWLKFMLRDNKPSVKGTKWHTEVGYNN